MSGWRIRPGLRVRWHPVLPNAEVVRIIRAVDRAEAEWLARRRSYFRRWYW